MSAVCPNCRQSVAAAGSACAEVGCVRRGYHGIDLKYLADKLDPRIGLLLDRKYLLVQVLGKGGMGIVMIALQQPLLREVALKLVSGVVIDDTVRGRFIREARAVAVLDHPNIVKLVDFGVADLDEDAPYMVMELVTGAESLRKVFSGWASDRPTWHAVGDVFGQLLSALSAAHGQGLVHRDIKPDNVMAKRASGYDYFVKVLDFGLAKSLVQATTDGPSLTEAGGAVGTPQYMAPEQMSREHFGASDQRVDLYAVGVMLFEVVTGRRPYAETETMALLMAKCDPDRDPLLTADELAELGPIEAVVRRAMAWAAVDRYASADELRAELQAAVKALGPQQRVPMPESAVDAGDLPTIATPLSPRTAAYVPTPRVVVAPVEAELSAGPSEDAVDGSARSADGRRVVLVAAVAAGATLAVAAVLWWAMTGAAPAVAPTAVPAAVVVPVVAPPVAPVPVAVAVPPPVAAVAVAVVATATEATVAPAVAPVVAEPESNAQDAEVGASPKAKSPPPKKTDKAKPRGFDKF